MERLTYFENGHWRLNFNGCQYNARFVDRLAAYEDTRLTPAEVRSLWKEWNAMMSVLNRIGGYDRLRKLAEADKDGRVIVTGAPSDDKRDGLRQKYRVYKAKDNTPVEDCFVLRPEKDPAARIAMEAYAKATDNKKLSEDILAALGDSGHVMVFPCNVGDTVWYVTTAGILRFAITNFVKNCDGDYAVSDYTTFPIRLFGKNVFLTREEAEAKLKEVQKDGNKADM